MTKLSNETEDSSQVSELEGELASLLREEEQLVEELQQLKTDNKRIDEELEQQRVARCAVIGGELPAY